MNVSPPAKPAFGKYVSKLLLTPSEPLAGCDMIRKVAVIGVTATVRFKVVLFYVLPETTLTVGGVLLLMLSSLGPLWQV